MRIPHLRWGAIPQRPSTRTIRHCQEKAITNCVLLSNWSKCILRRNSLENIPNCKCEIHVLQKRENANPATLLCILQWKAIPGLSWDLNAEMLNEKSISSKCFWAYKNALYTTHLRWGILILTLFTNWIISF